MSESDDYVDQEYNGRWTNELELIVSEIGERSKCMSILSSDASKYYNRQRTYLLVPASVISWSLNIFGMVSTFLGTEKVSESLVILIASIGNFVAATFTTVAEKSKAGDKVELFNQSSKDFYLLFSNIQTQLSFEPSMRQTAIDMFRECDKRYNHLLQSNPNIPSPVVEQFKSKYGRCDVAFPNHLSGWGVERVRIWSKPKYKIKYNTQFDDMVIEEENKLKNLQLKQCPPKDEFLDCIIDVDNKNKNIEEDTQNEDTHNEDNKDITTEEKPKSY